MLMETGAEKQETDHVTAYLVFRFSFSISR